MKKNEMKKLISDLEQLGNTYLKNQKESRWFSLFHHNDGIARELKSLKFDCKRVSANDNVDVDEKILNEFKQKLIEICNKFPRKGSLLVSFYERLSKDFPEISKKTIAINEYKENNYNNSQGECSKEWDGGDYKAAIGNILPQNNHLIEKHTTENMGEMGIELRKIESLSQ